MDWINVKNISIPDGNVKRIQINGVTIWGKPSPYTMLESVYFDGSGMFELPFVIAGSDTIRTRFATKTTSGNLFGYFNSSSADNNFCLYGGTSSYIRYDGELFRNWDLRPTTGIHNTVFSPTGLIDNSTSVATWSQKTFTGGQPCVGGLPNSTSPKNQWICYNFSIDGKCDLRPARRNSDNAYGLLDVISDNFYTGAYIQAAPVALTFANPDDNK